MSHWTIAVPVWGKHYVGEFIRHAIPSYRAAAEYAGYAANDIEMVIYTDDRPAITEAAKGFCIECRTVPQSGDKYRQLGDVHRDALKYAPPQCKIMLLTADMIVSREVFAASNKCFEEGKRAIVVGPSRTLPKGDIKPGMASRELLAWSMSNAHPFTKQTFFGGRALPPSTMRFTKGDNITMRGFHLHPLAVFKDRKIIFKGTLDQDLLNNYERQYIHVVTDADEMAAAEISPANMKFGLAPRPVGVDEIVNWANRQCNPMNWWLSTHRIVLAGKDDTDDIPFWDKIMKHAPVRLAQVA